MSASTAPTQPAAVIWHDAECGGYAADLSTWERLAAEHPGPLLDLGAGSGRVALHLAARGREIVAVDSDQELLAELEARAAGSGLRVETRCVDVRELDLGARRFELAIAPMQLAHLLGGAEGRARAGWRLVTGPPLRGSPRPRPPPSAVRRSRASRFRSFATPYRRRHASPPARPRQTTP